MQQVLTIVNSGSSGRGASYYCKAAICPRRARLDEEYPWEPGFAANVGTIFHGLCEHYHNGTLPNQLIPLENFPLDAFQEAVRLFSGYRQRYPVDYFGKVIGTEVDLPVGLQEESSKKDKEIIEAAVGVWPYTGRVDLIGEPNDVQRSIISEKVCSEIPKGIIMVDHKTKSMKSKFLPLAYRDKLQFKGYILMWNALYPDKPCVGLVSSMVYRHKNLKDESYELLWTPAPNEQETKMFKLWVQNAAVLAKTDFANAAACHIEKGEESGFYGVCEHRIVERCERI